MRRRKRRGFCRREELDELYLLMGGTYIIEGIKKRNRN